MASHDAVSISRIVWPWVTEVLVPMLAAHPTPSVCLFGNSDWGGLMPRCHAAAARASEAAGAPGHVRFVEGMALQPYTRHSFHLNLTVCSSLPVYPCTRTNSPHPPPWHYTPHTSCQLS